MGEVPRDSSSSTPNSTTISHEKEVDVESSHSVCVCSSLSLSQSSLTMFILLYVSFLLFSELICLSGAWLASFGVPVSLFSRRAFFLAFGREIWDTSLSDKTFCMCWRVTAALWHTSVLLQFSSLYQLLWASIPKLPDHLKQKRFGRLRVMCFNGKETTSDAFKENVKNYLENLVDKSTVYFISV